MNKNNAITVNHLTVLYGSKPVVDDISFVVPRGVICALIGPNGAGKSTVLQVILGLTKPLAGVITIAGCAPSEGRQLIAYVPQRASVDWNFPISVYDVVMMGRYVLQGFFKRPTAHDHLQVLQALTTVGMSSYAHHLIGELSGGQQQRVFLARALVQEREILILDEPFTGIDVATEELYVTVLKELRNRGVTTILVHHDIVSVADYADWAILLRTRLIKAGPIDAVITQVHLTHAYGRALYGFER